MKAGAAKSRPKWRSCRETNEDKWRQMKAGAKSRPEWRSRRETNEDKWRQEPRAGQNGDHEGRQMKTNEGRSSQEQARMEITKGDKWRETRWQRQGFWGSATQSLGSKNSYSFQLSGEKYIGKTKKKTPRSSAKSEALTSTEYSLWADSRFTSERRRGEGFSLFLKWSF